jgi:hypothetical protein
VRLHDGERCEKIGRDENTRQSHPLNSRVSSAVEQRYHNSVAAIPSYSVLSQQVLNCLKNLAYASSAVLVHTPQCYRVG